MSSIKTGFVGLSARGWASIALAPSLLKQPLSGYYSITAVSTSNATTAKASAEKWSELTSKPVKAYHGPTDAIASDQDIDLVVVAVKVPDHKKAVMPLIEKGKDIFVEWPLGNGVQESIDIAEAARAKGIRTIVGLQGWQSPVSRRVSNHTPSDYLLH